MNIIFLGYLTPILKTIYCKKNISIIGVGVEFNNPLSRETSEYCIQNDIFKFDARNINNNKNLKKLILKADLVIVAAFSQLISKKIISKTKYGFLNFHTSLLPYYRGGSPLEEQIIRGEKDGGITFHWMKEVFDEGPIVAQKKVRIGINDDYQKLLNKCISCGIITIDRLLEVDIKQWKTTYPEINGSYYNARKEYDAVIDFDLNYRDIINIFRAFNWKNWVHIKFKGQKLYINNIKKISQNNNEANGKVISISPRILVNCNDFLLEIKGDDLDKVLKVGDKI